MTDHHLLFSLLILLLVGITTPLAAQDQEQPVEEEESEESEEPQLDTTNFEDHLQYQSALEIEIGLRLYEEGDDYRSITALKRYRLLADAPSADYMANLIIGDIYRRNDFSDLGLQHFWSASTAGANLSEMDSLQAYHLGLQELCASLRAYVSCHAQLREIEAAYREQDRTDAEDLARYQRRFVEFVLRAPQTPDDQFSDPRLQRAFADLNARNQVFENLPLKSPALAGVLSAVIPGAGQAYTGRWLDALVALGFTGLFAGATAYSHFQLDSLPLTIISGLFTAGFYSGNIANAAVDARRQNAALYDDFFDALHQDLWPRHHFEIDDNQIRYDYQFDWPGHLDEVDPDAEPPSIPGLL